MQMSRVVSVVALLGIVVADAACGGCYAHAEEVRVEGTNCVAARPSQEAGCGEPILFVDNSCNEALVFESQSIARVEPGAKNVEVLVSGSTSANGRASLRANLGATAVTISWRQTP